MEVGRQCLRSPEMDPGMEARSDLRRSRRRFRGCHPMPRRPHNGIRPIARYGGEDMQFACGRCRVGRRQVFCERAFLSLLNKKEDGPVKGPPPWLRNKIILSHGTSRYPSCGCTSFFRSFRISSSGSCGSGTSLESDQALSHSHFHSHCSVALG